MTLIFQQSYADMSLKRLSLSESIDESIWIELAAILFVQSSFIFSLEVDAVLKGFLTDFPTIIGFVVINADGIPTKW